MNNFLKTWRNMLHDEGLEVTPDELEKAASGIAEYARVCYRLSDLKCKGFFDTLDDEELCEVLIYTSGIMTTIIKSEVEEIKEEETQDE